ncbi:MAG TPA: hypothetical protein VKY74_11865 [Chloroflexia bacterium]|nr:hypothetical protein [Chloroflexia bacterium]
MKRHLLVKMAALTLAVGLAGGIAHPAAAQGTLPAVQAPSAQQFSLTDTIAITQQTLTVTGTGMQAGDGTLAGTQFQLDLTGSMSNRSGQGTLQVRQVGGVIYFQGSGESKAHAIDLSKLPAGAVGLINPVPGGGNLDAGSVGRLLPYLTQVQALGAEAVEGAPTTRYQGVVDLAKLVGDADSGLPPAQQLPKDAKLTATVWIGDKDHYIHQAHFLLSLTVMEPGNAQGMPLNEDLLLTYRGFNAPVAVTALAAAQAEDVNVPAIGGLLRVAGFPAFLISAASSGAEMPVTMEPPASVPGPPTIAPPPVPVIAPPPGMPTTGAADPTGALALLALGLLGLGVGVRLRHVTATHDA